MTRGEKVIAFIQEYCIIPEGPLVGKPVILAGFQKEFIIDVYDNPAVTDTAILSMARKNAKTGTIAFLLLAHIVGPEAKQNSRIISGAMSRDQAAEVYNLSSKCVMLSPRLSDIIRIVPSSKKLIGLPMNVEYQAISAEGKTAHGKSPILAILDEVGQIRGPQSDFVDAITTAQGAYDNPLLIYISTQSATDNDLLSILIDDAKRNKHPKTVCHVYAADKDADVMDEAQWRKSNPALGLFRSESDIRKQAEKASRMPSFESTFRNLMLNQRVSTVNPFISKTIWDNNGAEQEGLDGKLIYCGLDLSKKTDLTAFIVAGLDTSNGVWDVYSYFWTPEMGLIERAKRDRQPYDVWVQQGFLRTTPGSTVDYDFVASEMLDILDGLDVQAIGFDRWRIDQLKKSLSDLGVELPLLEFGQGFKDMSPAIEDVENVMLNSNMRHGQHPVLTMCAANSVTVKDPSENRKLDKSKSTGRIDGMVALTMAIGVASKQGIMPMDIDDFISQPLVI